MTRPLLFAIILIPIPLIAAPVDFAREVRPILSEHCFACHGPDAARRKAELRLDTKEGALGKGESGAVVIVPGKPEQSEIFKRITSKDPEEIMPPPKEHKNLKADQVALLKRWIAEGATYTGHWSFQKVQQPPVPAVHKSQAALRTPADHFLLERLERDGLTFSPEEESARLIRRVSLDLTGLPPTVAEVDAFLADKSPGAYEKVVDRLLASQHFGERMAVPWLDLARFADTGGYHNDSLRDMWLWRDWVVKAFNDNKPFSDFTTEQIAGDLLPNATVDQKIASGFHRNVMTSDEGGLIDAEYLNLYVVDRVATTGITWLGLTVGCAQCHDHKYDPVTMRDFYGLYAFFHNVPENGKDGIRTRNPQPLMLVPTPDQTKELARLDSLIAATDKAGQAIAATLDAKQAEWEKTVATDGKLIEPKGPWTKFPLDSDGKGATDTGEVIDATLEGEGTFTEGKVDKSFRVEAKGWLDYGDHFEFEADKPFSVSAWLRPSSQGGAPFGRMQGGPEYRGWDLEFHGTTPNFHLVHKWPNDVIHVQAAKPLTADTFAHVTVTYDGSRKAAGVKLYVDGAEVPIKVVKDALKGSIKSDAPFTIGRRGTDSPFTGRVDDVRVHRRALSPHEVALLAGGPNLAIAAIPADKRTAPQKQQLQKFFRETQAVDYIANQAKLKAVRKEKADLELQLPNTMVMVEMEKPRDTFIKVRGQYDKNGDKVTAAAPAFLPQLPPQPLDGKRHTRLDLARWLTSPDHPLTARVAINRWWAMIFGTGIVKTVNDFGAQGEWPSHPELLDWLAADFMRDWNIKRAIKQMVMSTAYRQSSRIDPALLARDSENRLLARGPRHRLAAEFVRDNALAVSGLLNPEMGGKGILPFQPPGIWSVNEMGGYPFKQTRDAGQYRRGIYVYWRRSTPYPSFLTFDAPNREFCAAVRARTSTPLQSLVLMNDPVYVEAARAFAQRALKEGGADAASRLAFLWRTALGRVPVEKERAVLQQLLDRNLARYAQDTKAAEEFTNVGDLPKPQGVNVAELAAYTAVASVVLNLNETISN